MPPLLQPVYIYGLFDPTVSSHKGWRRIGGKLIRYVGKSCYPAQRLVNHASEARSKILRRNHRLNWLRGLLQKDVGPQFIILEETTKQAWQVRERFWIASFPKGQLVNSTAGGDGVLDLSPEGRARIGAASATRMLGNTLRRNTTLTQTEKDVISAGLLVSEKAAKAWAARKGKPSYPRTEETKRRNSEANIGNSRPKSVALMQAINIARDERGPANWITNGAQNKQVPISEPIPSGWALGFTNENHHLRNKSNPRWAVELKKQAKRRRGKMRWITDGEHTRMWMPGDLIPRGWKFGKTFKTPRNRDGTFSSSVVPTTGV